MKSAKKISLEKIKHKSLRKFVIQFKGRFKIDSKKTSVDLLDEVR